MLKIGITGKSGYLGQRISRQLENRRHLVWGIEREMLYGQVERLKRVIRGHDVIIHLAGAGVFRPWTKNNRKEIYDSRIQPTANLVSAIRQLKESERPGKVISISAIGIYKSGFTHDEQSSNYADNFLGKVAYDWEEQLKDLPHSVGKVIFRTGLVLGKEAKTVKNLLLPFSLGLGASLGNGKQPFPFIHVTDVVNAFIWAAESYQNNSVFNLVAPQQINNKEFTKAFARGLNRPVFLQIPNFVLQLILGNRSSLILESPEVIPGGLLKEGFHFLYPDIESALNEILHKKTPLPKQAKG